MRVTYAVTVSDISGEKYWDDYKVTREVTIESTEDGVLLAAIPAALEALSGLAGLALAERRIKLQESEDEDSNGAE